MSCVSLSKEYDWLPRRNNSRENVWYVMASRKAVIVWLSGLSDVAPGSSANRRSPEVSCRMSAVESPDLYTSGESSSPGREGLQHIVVWK